MKQSASVAAHGIAPLALLRQGYAAGLDGRASATAIGKRLDVHSSSVQAALRDATKKRLVRVAGGAAKLTPSGRRRLKVVMLGGAFEIIHPGHIYALSEARRLGMCHDHPWTPAAAGGSPTAGGPATPPLAPAPGTYVLER